MLSKREEKVLGIFITDNTRSKNIEISCLKMLLTKIASKFRKIFDKTTKRLKGRKMKRNRKSYYLIRRYRKYTHKSYKV